MRRPYPSISPAALRRCLLPTLLLGSGAALQGDDNALTTAVYAQVGNGYKREKLPDGRFKPEYYAIANGGMLPGTTRDATVDRMPYPKMAGLMAQFLARQNYFLAKDKKQAQLLIVLHWGTTIPFNDANYVAGVNQAGESFARMQELGGGQGATPEGAGPFGTTEGAAARAAEADFEQRMMMMLNENDARDRANEHNARLLGYLREINEHNGIQRWAGGGTYFDDLRADIEEQRYYVVVSAYDFREATEKNALKLKWVTRVSVRSPGHAFDKQAAALLASAHRYFGQESGRLVRQYTPEGRVEIGETEVLGVASDPRPTNPPDRQK